MSNFANSAQLKELAGYMGGLISVPQVVQNFTAENIYSEDERMIGRWIDGKPLYQKTYLFVGNDSNIFYFDANVTNIVLVDGFLTHFNPQTGNSHGMPYYFGRGDYEGTSRKVLYVILNSSDEVFVNNHRYFATLKYTKSTDTASDYHMASPYEFSTNETLIGTWIDGSPVYQKTFTGLNIPVDWRGTFYMITDDIASFFTNHSISYDKVIKINAIYENDGHHLMAIPCAIDVDGSVVKLVVLGDSHGSSHYISGLTLQYLK